LLSKHDGIVKTSATYIMRPEFPITPGASAIHGVLQCEAKDREDSEKVLIEFCKKHRELFEGEAVTTGWNVDFDVKIINNALSRHELPTLKFGSVFDMMGLAKRMFHVGEVGGFSLDAIYMALDPTRARLNKLKAKRASHSAEADVEITYEVLEGMLARAVNGEGAYTGGVQIRDMAALVKYALTPMTLTEWPIGKHKGKDFASVLRKDPQYVRWVTNQTWYDDPRYADLRHSIDALSKRSGMPTPDEEKMPF
jgi:DNA polymerase III epsilon subunit-like protein